MNLEELKIFENCEIGSTSPFYVNREKSFLGFDDSEWFSGNETYYLIETDRYDNVKIIDTSIIKERLEAKATEYNNKSISDRRHEQFYYEVKTLEKGFYDKET